MATRKKPTKNTAPVTMSLLDAADTAMGAMQSVMLSQEMPDPIRWEMDAAVAVLWEAIKNDRAWSMMMLAIPKGMTIAVTPMRATCVQCKGRVLIVPTPPPDTTGLAICQHCSFTDPYAP